jgi:hypothetical protein
MSTSRLTKKSALKYADMADSVEEAQNHVLSIQRRIKEIENQIRNLPHEEMQDSAVADYEAELKRQSDRRDLTQSAYLSLSRTVTAVRTWLTQLSPGYELQDYVDSYLLPKDGESCIEAVERCRADIYRLAGARASVARAVLPVADLYAESDRHVDALAARGRPNVSVDRDQLHVKHNVEGFASEAIVLLAWLYPDAMKAKLHQEIDDMRADELKRHTPVMPMAERVAKLAELYERIMAVEREEESYVCLAAEYNVPIPRRENANPAAVLGVSVVRVDQQAKILERRDAERRKAGIKAA